MSTKFSCIIETISRSLLLCGAADAPAPSRQARTHIEMSEADGPLKGGAEKSGHRVYAPLDFEQKSSRTIPRISMLATNYLL